jgi:glycosyltransferase involved in cell wall biosynthesis
VTKAPTLSIILPCYNESANIPVLVGRFHKFAKDRDFELILVDNGSTDTTAEVLKKLQNDPEYCFLRVVTIGKNIGYGHGIHTGLQAARGEILAYSHADAQTPPEDVFRAFELIEGGSVDIHRTIIKGHRPGRDKSNFFTRWLRIITRLCTGLKIVDINGQPKVFHRSLLETMTNPVKDFAYDTYVLYVASRKGLSVKTIDVKFEKRLHGQSKWASTLIRKSKTIAEYTRSIFMMSRQDGCCRCRR